MITGAVAQDAWTGTYLGINADYGKGHATVTNSAAGVDPGPFDYDLTTRMGGLTAGYNLQSGVVVVGVEGELNYLSPDGQGYIPSSNPAYHQDLTISGGVLADLTGRIGLGLDSTLLFAKGGVVYFGGQAKQETTKPGYEATPSGAFAGLTWGAGIEQKVSETVSIKAEYAHYGFGAVDAYQTSTVDDPPTPAGTKFPNSTTFGFDTVKVGVNFHF